MKSSPPTRREFIKQTLAGICAASVLSPEAWALAEEGIPQRKLGKTGVNVSSLGLGGYHLGTIRDGQGAVRLIREAIDMGVTFIDNAWEYHQGRSEELVGKALKEGYRSKAFVMTKHHGRDKNTALKHLDDSLRRLQTDVIDLWQFHEVIYEEDPRRIFAEGGGIEAAVEAKQAGKVRFVGFTGHKDPKLFLEMLNHDFEWDTVQMPVNALDPHFRSFQKSVMPLLTERGIGIIAMKTMAGGHLLDAKVITPREALVYVWSQPVSTIVSGIDSTDLLRANARFAREFKPMSEQTQAELLERTKRAAASGSYEPFKTTTQFDGWVGRELYGIKS